MAVRAGGSTSEPVNCRAILCPTRRFLSTESTSNDLLISREGQSTKLNDARGMNETDSFTLRMGVIDNLRRR